MKLVYATFIDTFVAKEIVFQQYKDFLKSFYGEDVSSDQFLNNFLELFSELSGKPIEYFKQLSIPEIFLLLIQLRIYTLGPGCKINIKLPSEEKDKEDTEEKNTISLNLERIKQDLLDFASINCPYYIETENIVLKLNFPSYERITSADSIEEYIVGCKIGDKILTNLTNEQASILFDKLSAKVASQVLTQKEIMVTSFKNINFLAPYDKFSHYYLNFDLSWKNFLWYCKLLFNETLEVLYDNLYYLTSIGRFDLNYIENNCTPGEYVYFLKKLNASMSSKTRSSQQIPTESIE